MDTQETPEKEKKVEKDRAKVGHNFLHGSRIQRMLLPRRFVARA